jgi:hypothetical protein
MSITPILAAGLSQDVLSEGNSNQQQALQSLQNSLASGNLTSAQWSFQILHNTLQDSATANGTALSSTSPVLQALTALGSALSSGDVSTSQSVFATLLGTLKTTASAAQINEATAASQSIQLVQEPLSTSDASSATTSSSDLPTSILQNEYASQSGLDVYA